MIKRKLIYISGGMTGYPMKNKPMFDKAEVYLKSKGYSTINPAAKPNEILDRNATENICYIICTWRCRRNMDTT